MVAGGALEGVTIPRARKVVVQNSTSLPSTLRFGVFELDPRAGELRKKGMKIRLQGQPVEILVMLLERPGETVTREELQEKLWPGDTFVDFEQGLNNAMKRLRAALDDDAESPHFIEPCHGGDTDSLQQSKAPVSGSYKSRRLTTACRSKRRSALGLCASRFSSGDACCCSERASTFTSCAGGHTPNNWL